METKVLKTAAEYEEACDTIYRLIHASEEAMQPESKEGEQLELLSLLVEKYEREYFPIETPNPIAAIRFRMEQMNLNQNDIAPLFGGKTRVSEVLNGRRSLSLKMIVRLNEYLDIPIESLIAKDEKYELAKENKKKLMMNESIKQTINRKKGLIN